MRVVAVVSSNPEEAQRCGFGVGLLARGDIACERLQPEETLVDRLVLREPPDLLMLDADLPGFNALHMMRTLRRFQAYMLTPIFLFASAELTDDGRNSGATCVFRKPVALKDVEEALARHVKPMARKAPRKGLKGPCVVTKGGLKIEGRITDISILGAQIVVMDKLPQGALVHLAFALMLQKTPHVIRVQGRVVREVPGGYGLAFSALDQQARSLITAYAKT
jgi:CheY-like chemotaxis protein